MRDYPNLDSQDYEKMLTQLIGDDEARAGSSPFYEPLDPELRKEWITWFEQWRTALQSTTPDSSDGTAIFDRMRLENPKFVLREWMLVDAYTQAANEQEAELFSLYSLIQHPYEEGSEYEVRRYYRRAPDEALTTGGTAFMS